MYISYAYDYVQVLYFACQKCFESLEPASCYLPDMEMLDRYFLLMKAQMSLIYFKKTTLKKLLPEKCEEVMNNLMADYRTALSPGLQTYYDYFQPDSPWWNAKMNQANRTGIRYQMDDIYADLRERVLSLWKIKGMSSLALYELFERSFQSLRNQEIPVYKWNDTLYKDFCLRIEWEKQQIETFDPLHFPAHFKPQPDEEYQQEKKRYDWPLPPEPTFPPSACLTDYWQGAPEILDDVIRQCTLKGYIIEQVHPGKPFPLAWKGPKNVLYDILNQCTQKGHIRTYPHIDLIKFCINKLGLTGSVAHLTSKYSATLLKRPPKENRIEVKPGEQ